MRSAASLIAPRLSLTPRGASWLVTLAALLASSTLTGCGGDDVKYEPRGAPSGVTATLPAVPNVPQKPVKNGDAYTVWGASYSLRSRVHNKDVVDKPITVEGYITKTNLGEAPECAVHKTGKGDPDDCKPPVPAFWIGDTKDAAEKDSIKVMGWASNFANIYDAIEQYKKDDAEEYKDVRFQVTIPNPIPNAGAKVKITGGYGTTYTRHTTGTEADPIMGVLTMDKFEYIEKPAEPGTLPGMKK